MFGDYVAWWSRQMIELLPQPLRPGSGSTDALLIEAEPDQSSIELTFRRGELVSKLGRFKMDAGGFAAARAVAASSGRSAIWLRQRPETLLEKDLALPLAAERELERALTYEMDRETPFSADEVWWNWRIVSRDRQRGTLKLRLFLLPKGPLRPLVEALNLAGLAPAGIEACGADGVLHRLALDPHHGAPRGWPGRLKPLAAACAILAMIAAIVPFARQSVALNRVEARIASLQPGVDEVQKLRGRTGDGGRGGISADLASEGDILNVLAKTTDILPDDTYLTDFALHGRKLSLTGQSAAAARLIGALAADPFFKDPAFSSAVTHPQGAKLDSFSINAEIRP